MRIAVVGSRGVPPNYGGYETFAAELGRRLVARGHDVLVYCRSTSYPDFDADIWEGLRRVVTPAWRRKHLETVTSTLLALIHVTVFRTADAIILVNGINAFVAWIPRIVGIPVYLNVDGIERQRDKWGRIAKSAYHLSEMVARRTATRVIADAEVVADYYRSRYATSPIVISYGADVTRRLWPELLRIFDVESESYALYVSRLEPENNAHMVIEAYKEVDTSLPLLLVGDAPYAREYKERLRKLASHDTRIRLVGAVYGDGYRALLENACVYLQATSVGGTHPALIEAMGAGNAVVAYDTPEHREVLRDAGLYFTDTQTLASQIRSLLTQRGLREELRGRAQREVSERYSWDAVTSHYERLLAAEEPWAS